ncbi:MarR family protein [Aquimixticola soesokkakensis]|uniref:MarR family protein n=1 Tax=Aquimixticola soesokkakensis TaxID=1519096 RepID=A0A1Y5T1X9_9RHOB|nr:MarR family winged helix-turn-helix transcriptional regulator [Aquimixticola soesokkakensis]SLN54072.1 MarR family protein [Aquimixticola soesokkakensis]
MTQTPPSPQKNKTPYDFDLEDFLPFLLNQTAEVTGRAFQSIYRARYGLTRTQWRVLAIIGRYGGLTGRAICDIAHEEKTRVSRAVAALEQEGLLSRTESPEDKRAEILSLTEKGQTVFADLGREANAFDARLKAALGPEKDRQLRAIIATLREIEPDR